MARLYQDTQPIATGRLYQPVAKPTGRLYAEPTTKANLTTLEGLEQLAKERGFEMPTKKIIEKKGEITKKIYSGGFISDVFDTLNAIQYGVTGLIKGKGFMEGVKTRQSFSDEDALGEYGIPGMIGGIALDIAVDPLTYIPPLAVAKKVPGLVKGVKAVGKVAKQTKIGQMLGRSFIYRFGQDKVYKEIAERSIKNISVGNQNLLDIARPLTKLDPLTQKIIADARKAGKLTDLTPEVLAKAKPAFDELDRLGNEAVKVGLLSKEVYEKNVGKYIARLYRTKEAPVGIIGKVKGLFDKKPLRIDLSRFKKRTDIPEDIREAMGEILEAGYPTAKGLVQLNQAIERASFFGVVAKTWGKDTLEKGFSKLPDTKTLGELAGKVVPNPIFDDIQEIIRPRTGITRKIVAGFKFSKVILNPATHARNIMSNFLLNSFEGLSPARLDIYGTAAKHIAIKGKWYKEAQQAGLGLNTFASREVKDILLGPEVKGLKKVAKIAMDKIGELYQKEEEYAKLAQYIFQRKKGLTPDKAWQIAEKATFNYAQVTPFIRKMRESLFGYPFITFTYKATPQVAKTLATKPTRISNIGKIRNAIEEQAGIKYGKEELKRERASEPDWVKDGLYVKLPIKDKHGRSAYFDMTYILPFGDIISGQFWEKGIKRETGLPESAAEAQLKKLPFFNLIREISKNQDFYGNKVWLESDSSTKQLGDLMRHLMKTYLPPLVGDQIPGGYRATGERRPTVTQRVKTVEEKGIEEGGMQARTLFQELLRNIGVKIQPVDVKTQEGFMEWEKKKALQTFLKEKGVIKGFDLPYVPKTQ